MTTDTRPLWPHQQRGLDEVKLLVNCGETWNCLTSPTGGGKSLMIRKLIQWGVEQQWPVALYTHRQILRDQLSRDMESGGISHGLTAAGFSAEPWKRVQICMMQTVGARLKNGREIPAAKLVIVDECHDQSRGQAEAILRQHEAAGASIIGVTATPVDVGHLYKNLVVAGTNSELRACGAHLWCHCYEPTVPGIDKELRRMKTGEFVQGDVVKAIMTPVIFGHVINNWKTLNSDARPTILFAPGVKESIWFMEQFEKAGVKAAHICGETVIVDGVEHRSDKAARDQVLDEVRSGRVKVICNRIVLREGWDFPELYHCILATCIGSYKGYLQSIGRLLRAHPSLDKVQCQDHGANIMRHGSPNLDREWDMNKTESQIAAERKERLKEHPEECEIVCPECSTIRSGGPLCPSCGFQHKHSCRRVIQLNGSLKLIDEGASGSQQKMPVDKEKAWERLFYIGKNKGWSFSRAAGIFRSQFKEWPRWGMKLTPKSKSDWKKEIGSLKWNEMNH